MTLTCKDCKFYLPVDVFQGICKVSKGRTGPDEHFCDKADRIPKCRFCSRYNAEKDYLGKCMETTLAYPDMIASKCADFEWSRQN